MSDPTLFPVEPVDRAQRERHASAGHPAWVVTWGTRMALLCGRDEAAVRARVRRQTRVALADDEIHVRAATPGDARLVSDHDFGNSQADQVALTDWRYGLSLHEREREGADLALAA